MNRKSLVIGLALSCVIILGSGKADAGKFHPGGPTPTLLVTGLEGGSGSTIGPGGALYVTEGAAGRISRVDPKTGEITTFASGLPKSIRHRHRWGDRRRVHRQDRVRTGHPRRP